MQVNPQEEAVTGMVSRVNIFNPAKLDRTGAPELIIKKKQVISSPTALILTLVGYSRIEVYPFSRVRFE